MNDATPSRAALLLSLVLLAAGLAGCAQSDPPDDPSSLDYIYGSDHPDKAPHPVAFDGSYERLEVTGPSIAYAADGPVRVPAGDTGTGSGSVGFPAQLVVHGAQGTFQRDDGSETSLENDTVRLTADEAFEVTGLAEVRSDDHTFTGGEARAHGAVVAPEGGTAAAVLQAGDGGATVADVEVAVNPPPGGGGDTAHGTVELEPGEYAFGAGPAAVPDPGTVDLPSGDAWVTVVPDGSDVTLRGDDRQPAQVRLDAREFSGTVDAGADQANLDVQAVQWFEEDRPWFQADFEATFEGGDRERSVTLEEGENETFWVRGSERGEVGTAVDMRPREEPRRLKASFGVSWYEDTDPHVLRRMAEHFGAAFEAFFQDPATRTFEPGEALYIPFIVGAPNGTDPGTYRVQGWIHGENAKSDRVTVEVTVVES